MYAWMFWRDTRARLLIYLVLSALLFIISMPALSAFQSQPALGRWVTVGNIALFGTVVGGLAALGLGSSGPGEHWDRGTMEFLVTRPRPRRYIIWTAWAVGMAELLVFATVGVFVATTALYIRTGDTSSWRLLLLLVPLFAVLSLAYAITLFFSVLTHSGQKGLAAGLGMAVAYYVICVALGYWKHTDSAPVLSLMLAVVGEPGFAHPVAQVPMVLEKLLGCFGGAFVFSVAAQIAFDRAEL
jgi:ABC-type transport system involved in multi-copper enzyme maturation permease subunit